MAQDEGNLLIWFRTERLSWFPKPSKSLPSPRVMIQRERDWGPDPVCPLPLSRTTHRVPFCHLQEKLKACILSCWWTRDSAKVFEAPSSPAPFPVPASTWSLLRLLGLHVSLLLLVSSVASGLPPQALWRQQSVCEVVHRQYVETKILFQSI